jgi:hypothetical protein
MVQEVKLVIQEQEAKTEKEVKLAQMVRLEYKVPQENKVRRAIQENKVPLA